MSTMTLDGMSPESSSTQERWYEDPKIVNAIKVLLAPLFDLLVLFLKRRNTAKSN